MTGQVDTSTRTKAIFQIGALFMCVFILAMLCLSIFHYYSNMNVYLAGKRENITDYLQSVDESLFKQWHIEWSLDYWEKNPDIIKEEMYKDKYYLENRENLCKAAQESYYYTDEEIMALPEDEQKEVATVLYNSLLNRLATYSVIIDFDNMFIIDVGEENRGSIIYESADFRDRYYGLGTRWDYDISDHDAVKRYASGETLDIEYEIVRDNDFDGRSYYIGYLPLSIEDGKVRFVLGIAYDWDNYEYTLRQNLGYSSLLSIIAGLIVTVLLMIFLYLIIVKPVSTVSESVAMFTADKDSGKVVETMETIHSRNEVGLLAENISQMVDEIDRYSKEITTLATEKERVKAELEFAAKIQSSMLSKKFPVSSTYELYALMDPAKEVGGDFYDFFTIDYNHLGLVIADVSGKGIPASLFMAMSKMNIRNFAGPGITPAETLKAANDAIVADNVNKMFVTVWFGIVELSTGHVCAANAGHEYPVIRRANGKFEVFKDKHGLVLGALNELKTHDYEFDLGKGDTLFLYTDGAPEANDKDNNMFGMDRLVEALNKDPDKNPAGLIDAVKESISEFVGEADQFDDLTMMCFKYYGRKNQ